MGCNISPIVAIVFINHIESRALGIFSRFGIFKRYIDDIFVLVEDETQANTLFNIIENVHRNISFEIEHPKTDGNVKSLSLLDLTIEMRTDGSIEHKYYQKPAKQNLFIHQNSHLPTQMKENIIKNEIERRKAKCSRPVDQNLEVSKFTEHLKARNYSTQFINGCKRGRRNTRQTNRKFFYLDIPFISDSIDNKIKSLFRRRGIFIHISRRSNKLFNVLKPKRESVLHCNNSACKIKNDNICHQKNVVYNLQCSGCNKNYIGHTQRFLHTRIYEHSVGRQSNAHPHFQQCSNGQFSVEVLDRQKDCINAKLSEAIFIKSKNPMLNDREEILQLF